MLEYKIIDVEVYDHNPEVGFFRDGEQIYRPSLIEVHVTIAIIEKIYLINYQTSETEDVGAFSSILNIDDNSGDDSIALIQRFGDFDFRRLKRESNAQEIWEEYVDENYMRNRESFRGMDANSEFNEMEKL